MRDYTFCTLLGALGMLSAATALPGQTLEFGPLPYLSRDDLPAEFGCSCGDDCELLLETFEDGDPTNLGFAFVNGMIMGPDFTNGMPNMVDSVDADDGDIDGVGSKGWSYYAPGQWIQIDYPTGTTNAGVVWTDGNIAVSTVFEAYDLDGNLIAAIGPHQLSDTSFMGTTSEDRFFGVYHEAGVSHAIVRNIGMMGIEIDHAVSGDCTIDVPEPATGLLLPLMTALGMAWVRRRQH